MTDYVSRVIGKRHRNNAKVDLVSHNKKLLKKLKKIDPSQRYMYYPMTCEPGTLLDENKADGVTEDNKHLSEAYLKGGLTWNEYCLAHQHTEKQANHIVKAIQKLHKAGIVHGDFNRHNIVMGSDGLPRLIDFGNSIYDSPQHIIDLENELVKATYPIFSVYPMRDLVKQIVREKLKILIDQRGN